MGFEVVVIDGVKYIFRPINQIDYSTLREINTFFIGNPFIIGGSSFYSNFQNKGVDGVLISYPHGKLASVRLSPLQMKRVFLEMLSVYSLIDGMWTVGVNDFYYYYLDEEMHALVYPKFDSSLERKITFIEYVEVLYQIIVGDGMRGFPLTLKDSVAENEYDDWVDVFERIFAFNPSFADIKAMRLFRDIQLLPTPEKKEFSAPRFQGNALIYKGVIEIVETFSGYTGLGLEPFFTAVDIFVKCHARSVFIQPQIACNLSLIYFGWMQPDLDVSLYIPAIETVGGEIQSSAYLRYPYIDQLLIFYYYQINYISDYFIRKSFSSYVISSTRREAVDFPQFIEMDLPRSAGLDLRNLKLN